MIGFPKPEFAKGKRKAKRERAKRLRTAQDRVWDRDGSKCRACGFPVVRSILAAGLPIEGHVHHLVKRSQSKALREALSNLVLVCRSCHQDIHAYRLRVSGNADETLTWERKS